MLFNCWQHLHFTSTCIPLISLPSMPSVQKDEDVELSIIDDRFFDLKVTMNQMCFLSKCYEMTEIYQHFLDIFFLISYTDCKLQMSGTSPNISNKSVIYFAGANQRLLSSFLLAFRNQFNVAHRVYA